MSINSKREVMYVPEWRGCSGPGCHVLVSAAGRETIHGSPRSSLSSYHGIWPGSVVALYFVPLSPAIQQGDEKRARQRKDGLASRGQLWILSSNI